MIYLMIIIACLVCLISCYLTAFILKKYLRMWKNIDKIVAELEYIHNEIENTKD